MIKEFETDSHEVYLLPRKNKKVDLDLEVIRKIGYKEPFVDYLQSVLNSLPDLPDFDGMQSLHRVDIVSPHTSNQLEMIRLGVEESMMLNKDFIFLGIPKESFKEE